MVHIVTAPLVITKKEDGSDLYLYENAQLPDFASDEEIKRLTDLGMIDKVTASQAQKVDAPVSESN